ncbi:MAG: hypothetical protein DU489_12315 [Nitrosomonas sp.]|uniref:hypothetical protein n=1 Tax=Nitrosomonas sp. TaxID=42353 RepID=UPI0032EFF83B
MTTQIEIAQHLDLSTRQIRELQSAGVFSKSATLDEARLAYIRRLREQAAGRAATNGLDLASERARLAKMQADKLEAELAAKRGDMISLAEAVMGWSDLVNAFRQKMLSLPVRASDSIPGIADRRNAERILTGMVYEALSELSRWKPDGTEEFETEAAGNI